MDNKEQKIWKLLGVWQNIEPRPNYVERFKARIAQQKTWPERFWHNLRAQLALRHLVLQPALALGICLLVFIVSQTYNNYSLSKNLLANLDERQWEMLANYDTVSKMDLVKGL